MLGRANKRYVCWTEFDWIGLIHSAWGMLGKFKWRACTRTKFDWITLVHSA